MKKNFTYCMKMLFAGGFLVVSGILLATSVKAQSFVEEFDTVSNLAAKGWDTINHSVPLGPLSWFQGNGNVFYSYSGVDTNSYVGVNYLSTNNTGTISNWLISPQVTFNNGDVIYFYTRKTDSAAVVTNNFPDRLQLRYSLNGPSSNVGTTATDTGDFRLLVDINPTLSNIGYPIGYPYDWTRISATISGLSGPTAGRFAFRYFVTSGGPNGSNSDYIGIDSLNYVSSVSGIQNLQPKLKVSFYPNPTNGIFNMQFNSDKSLEATVEVLNELGQVVYNRQIHVNGGTNDQHLDLSMLPSGAYSVKLKTSYELFNQKLIIQN